MNINRDRAWILLAAGLAMATAHIPAAVAESSTASPDHSLSPYFFIEGGDPKVDHLPLEKTDVAVDISGVIANVTVRQTYKNEGSRAINARYVFPASTRAAVHGMKMTVGDEVVEAKIHERGEARQIYETAKREGKTASLLEEQRPNVFTMEVGNIMPGDTVKVELRYTELIVPTDGTYELVYPTVVGPRFASEGSTDSHDQFVASPYLASHRPGDAFSIKVHLESGIPVSKLSVPSHAVNVAWTGKNRARIALDKSEAHGGNRDFILDYRLAGGQIQSGLLLQRGGHHGENFFLLMMEPPERVQLAEIVPREYVFIVDVSGSMGGFPLDTAKALLKNLVGSLRPTDTFNVVLFSGSQYLMAKRSLPANAANIDQALDVIDNQRGGGGTYLLPAIQSAMALPTDSDRSRSFVVITDGYIAAEKPVFDYIRGHLGKANVFAFGIGAGVNRYLIEGIARAGLGEPFVVTGPEHAEKIARQFSTYIESPVLTHINVRYDGFDTYDLEPASVPDLLAKRPLVIFGKWRGAATGKIVVTGTAGSGRFEKTIDVSGAAGGSNPALEYLWARTRIADLADFNNQLSEDDKATVTKLGLAYNLLTPYTSFVAVHHKVRNAAGDAADVDQPLALPQNVSEQAVGMTGASEPSLAVLAALGLMLLAGAWVIRNRHRGAGR